MGALTSIYSVYQARHYFFRKAAIPVCLLIALFAWAVFHLLFLAQDPILQYEEFTSIWKRTFIGAVFALGFGIALSAAITKDNNLQNDNSKNSIYWLACKVIAYVGLFTPTAIYLIKFCLAAYGPQLGVATPLYLQPYIGSNSYYIAKTAYMCFCLPMFAAGLGLLYFNIANDRWLSLMNLIYIASIRAVVFVFNGENIKNGFVYCLLLVIVFILCLLFSLFKKHFINKTLLIILFISTSAFLLMEHINKNESWKTFVADAKIAWQIDQYSQWRVGQYPVNELGKVVSGTNYERVAWAKAGVRFIAENPLGYGLVERSFGHFGSRQWPGTTLTQSHSGWIDLALGMGIPGLGFVLSALFILLYRLSSDKRVSSPIDGVVWWILLASLLMWCTTEISQKVYFDSLIFWLAIGAGLTLNRTRAVP
ncbi:hypothetical protein G6678_01670 [Polynucleobacter paneuropaeus]|nr:hypothetical protein G6678_01670 [Polynucleobacter paneuropaeus]